MSLYRFIFRLAMVAAVACLSQACLPQHPAQSLQQGMTWRKTDGERLAKGVADNNGGWRLDVFSRDGRKLEEHPLPGPVLAVAWSSRQDLLVIGYRLQEFSFGANLSQWLVRLHDGRREQLDLWDTTLKPGTARNLKNSLSALLPAAFSPAGDEVIFTRLHDPPQFPAYLELRYRNWQVPAERKLLQLSVQPVSLGWEPTGEVVTCRSGSHPAQRVELWPDAAGAVPAAAPAPAAELLWTLRKWRFEGLITPAEFLEVVLEKQP